jgi:FkbM family methyltransferase
MTNLSHRRLSANKVGVKVLNSKILVSMYLVVKKMLGDFYYTFCLSKLQNARGRNEIKTFLKHIKSGMIVADVGANIGTFTIPAVKKTGENGKVYAFEPEPVNLRILRKRIKRALCANYQKAVCVIPSAITDKQGLINLYTDLIHPANHSIYKENLIKHADTKKVKTNTIDNLFFEKNIRLDVLKIDVEGAENLVIRGAENTIKKYKPVIISEYWPEGVKIFNKNPKEYIEKLLSMGYLVDGLKSKEGDKKGFTNLVFTP